MGELERRTQVILDANKYLVLGTCSGSGASWVSPVYFAHVGTRWFLWASRPDTRHSQNIEENADVALMVFDSQVGDASAFYARATAERCPDEELLEYAGAYCRQLVAHGATTWTPERLTDVGAELRLYRARVYEASILAADCGPERRIPVAIMSDLSAS